ncbi:High-affinity branched-chain amino acid transport system permease protein LivH [subsurface metagenome]
MAAIISNIVLDGVLMGGIYALIAMGFNLQYGVARVLNLSHGEFIMFGGFACFSLYTLFGINPLLSLAIVAPGLFIIGFLLHRTVFRNLLKSSPSLAAFEGRSLLATFGLLFIIQYTARLIWPGLPKQMSFLAFPIYILGATIMANRVVALSFAIVIGLAFYLFLSRTRMGKAIRAAAQDPTTASLMGVNINRVLAICFGLGALLAGFAAVLHSMCFAIATTMGLQYTIIALIVVVLGGLGSIPGAFIGGLILGIVSEILRWTEPVLAMPVFYSIFLILLLVRPKGILGK